MIWLALLNLFLTLANTLTNYVREQKLMDAGAANEIAKSLQANIALLDKVRRARADAGDKFDSGVRDDADFRD